MSERFHEHLENDEFLRRELRDTRRSLQNFADLVLPRRVLSPPRSAAQTTPGRVTMTFTTLRKDR